MKKDDLLLYLVTDRAMADGNLEQIVEEALTGGVTIVQLREKDASFEQFCERAHAIKCITDRYNVPLIINDNIEVCLAVNASGVHLGASDCDIATARKILGNGKIIGGSARDVETAQKLQNDGADYLGVGAVFGTSTKLDAKTINLQILQCIATSVDIPVVAIGGINEQNVELLKGTGIAGIAVISSLIKAKDAKKSSQNFVKILKTLTK